uniref:Uncharacterized protein n=1 Tax=Knipowitschia caucasica TaxID=637954 RepID=A0AAV2L190_KNICA
MRTMGFHNVDWGRLEDSFSSHHKRVAVRQQEIVISAPPVENVKARWPALHTERQVLAEFNQITSSKLGNDFSNLLETNAWIRISSRWNRVC